MASAIEDVSVPAVRRKLTISTFASLAARWLMPRVQAFSLIGGRRSLAGSLIGGIAETQELLDWCAERRIAADVEVIPVQRIDAAYERMLRGDVRYRFVVDLATL